MSHLVQSCSSAKIFQSCCVICARSLKFISKSTKVQTPRVRKDISLPVVTFACYAFESRRSANSFTSITVIDLPSPVS